MPLGDPAVDHGEDVVAIVVVTDRGLDVFLRWSVADVRRDSCVLARCAVMYGSLPLRGTVNSPPFQFINSSMM